MCDVTFGVLAHGRPGNSLSSERAYTHRGAQIRCSVARVTRTSALSPPASPHPFRVLRSLRRPIPPPRDKGKTQPFATDMGAGAAAIHSHEHGEHGGGGWPATVVEIPRSQCRSIRGPRNTHGPLRFASVMCVNVRLHRQHQHYSARRDTTLGTCGRDAS